MSGEKILIVEDEERIARVLELELEHEGYETKKVLDGLDALSAFREGEYDLVLLDVMLPGMDGMSVLRRIRQGSDVPVIMLTAKDEIADKVSGLDLGASDYVTKPFDMEELLARVRAALRKAVPATTLAAADLTVNEEAREVTRAGQLIDLTPREYELLLYLLKNKRHVLSREQLLDGVWGYDYYGDTNVVDVYIRYVRNKVDKPFDRALIQTVRGVGYVLKE
ncbi:response regulator transcription factor [Domibacillus enclensis]|uniref:DNA-binding response regulator n=1 Tax=Domibacillus enclensis TaxID=1017273 RepID=A0A1N6TTX7_9BACI|nr:response regulator transcription factor [Domibacillus enclensis]OXS78357.1 DNA-binding response regulator [Domibacillus enclensis]SIQ56840.1 DNA-binding response regulator, OmpR family, contains REC and winged-helix (wHTH) domain [Domibacillus enclensis]